MTSQPIVHARGQLDTGDPPELATAEAVLFDLARQQGLSEAQARALSSYLAAGDTGDADQMAELLNDVAEIGPGIRRRILRLWCSRAGLAMPDATVEGGGPLAPSPPASPAPRRYYASNGIIHPAEPDDADALSLSAAVAVADSQRATLALTRPAASVPAAPAPEEGSLSRQLIAGLVKKFLDPPAPASMINLGDGQVSLESLTALLDVQNRGAATKGLMDSLPDLLTLGRDIVEAWHRGGGNPGGAPGPAPEAATSGLQAPVPTEMVTVTCPGCTTNLFVSPEQMGGFVCPSCGMQGKVTDGHQNGAGPGDLGLRGSAIPMGPAAGAPARIRVGSDPS